MRISPAQAAQVLDQPNEQLGTLSSKELLDAAVMFFTMLRISPSYELARKMNLGPLGRQDLAKLPPDFGQVLKTYETFGDVQQVLFAEWWRYRGVQALTAPSEPAVRFLGLIGAGETDPSPYQQSLEHHFTSERTADGLPISILLSMPLGLGRAKLVAQLEQVIDILESQATAVEPTEWGRVLGVPTPAALNYDGWMQGLGPKRNATQAKALSSLILRSLRSDLPDWKVQCLVTPSTTRAEDALRAERNKWEGLSVTADRRLLQNDLLRDLRNSRKLVENAARGRYPSSDSVPEAKFEWPEIGERLRTILAWEDAQNGWRRRVTRLSGRRTIPRCPIRLCAKAHSV
jgi:hypothetical protein